MGIDGWILLRRLHRAAKKLKLIILSFNDIGHRWRLASILGSHSVRRRLSFNDRPGLREFSDGGVIERSRSSVSSSSATSDEDIDGRAEAFIANFYRQLRMERQVSLQLRYVRGSSFGSTGSD